MFLSHLQARNAEQTLNAVRGFVSSLGPLTHQFECAFEATEDFGGKQAAYVDIFPTGADLAKDHKKFGGIFVRVWLFGEPAMFTSGIFLGAERAEQSEPRRGVAFTRSRLGHGLEAFETAEGFSYHTWSSGNFPWTTKSSRAVARQLEQFISFRQDAANAAQEAAIESQVGKAILFLDQNLHLLKPIPDFGKGIIQEYYSENLPELATPNIDSTTLIEVVASFDSALGSVEVGVHANVELIHRVASCLLSKRFLIATGLAGSGKTKLAQAFARWLTPQSVPADPFKPGSTIKGIQNDYTVVAADAGVVELATEDGKLVPLPRVIIQEWADYIQSNDVPESVSGRELRDKIEAQSKITGYLHRLESHYKPAAFALVAARKSTESAKCYEVVPVGADWTGTENILGYPDGLKAAHYVAKPALDLILHAADHGDVAHFLVLDEMNLSHVERYFADILSIIESDEGLELYSGDMTKPEAWRKTSAAKPVPPKLKQLPENLFIIGTVNVDETTYMFSPKVLDRANVIEFRMDAGELEGFLGNPAKPDLSKLDGKGASFGKAFVDASKSPVAVPGDVKPAYDAEMLLLFKTLQAHGAEFGYRTAYETARFIHFYKLLGNLPIGDKPWFPGAFDCVVFQKLLPKLHGSRAKLGPVLKKLWFLCVNPHKVDSENTEDREKLIKGVLKAAEEAARSTDKKAEPSVVVPAGAPYPLSAEKIGRMWRLLIENGFASFAEA